MSVAQVNALMEKVKGRRTPPRREMLKLRAMVDRVTRWPITDSGRLDLARADKFCRRHGY